MILNVFFTPLEIPAVYGKDDKDKVLISNGRRRIKISSFLAGVTLCVFIGLTLSAYANNSAMKIKLKPPHFKEETLKSLLERRLSVRDFQDRAIPFNELSSILWATCGKKYDSVTGATRTAPSAGAAYPLELYLAVGKDAVDGLRPGLYRYIIEEHALEPVLEEDIRTELSRACLGQDFIRQAPISLVIVADFKRTTQRYGERGENYVYMEAGHASQNTYLAVTALGLSTVEVGAFLNDRVSKALSLDEKYIPLIVMPIGYAK